MGHNDHYGYLNRFINIKDIDKKLEQMSKKTFKEKVGDFKSKINPWSIIFTIMFTLVFILSGIQNNKDLWYYLFVVAPASIFVLLFFNKKIKSVPEFENNGSSEKIVCSAIEIKGVNEIYDGIYLGLRHANCFAEISKVRNLVKDDDEWRVKCLRNNTQGFLTTKNRFVDREEAMIIARENNQVIKEFGNGIELYSECLY